MPKIQLNDLQKQAVEYLDGPLLVLAGPGTGKTQLLSSKVAYILEHTDTAPENILCLTFTENGASNMRTRLLSIIGPEARHINIHTYHAFGQSIIAQYKNYNPTYPRRLEDTVDEVTKFKIVHEIQAQLPALDILKNDNTSDILDTISSAKSARLAPGDLAEIATANNQASASLNSELSGAKSTITPVLANLQPRMKFADALAGVYQPLAEILTKYTSDQPIVGNIEPEANYMLRSLMEIIDAEQAKDKPSVSPLTKWKNAHFEKDEAGNYRLSNRVANLKLASLASIMQQYNDYLAAHALYDFDDMIEESIGFLRDDAGFRLTLSERYQYILLDEFQDTNPSQFEIIRLLTDYEQPAVMAVGDDDQAIFEFQGANASNLLDFQNHYNAKVITLLDNYRSNSEILDFSHCVAEQIDDSFAKKHGIAKKLVSRIGAYGNVSSEFITRHEFISADAEYYWVAERVRHLVDAGTDPSEIAIITPKHKYIAPLLPYLKAQDLNIAYEKRSDVLQDPQIHQLLTLARFASDASHVQPTAHQLLEVLSFPFWQVDALAAIQTIHQAQHDKKSAFDYLASSQDAKIQKIAHFLAELVKISYDAPLELFLDYLIGVIPLGEYQSPYLPYYTTDSDKSQGYSTFELYENLNTLKSTLVAHTKAQQPKLADLIHFLDDYELAGAGLVSTSPYQDDSNSIQVMTAFKSKGLEFQHVFLIAVDSLSWGKAKGNNNMLALPKNLVQIRHTGITDDERLRVFFVALTRAKQTLTLTNSVKDFAGKSPARLEYLMEYESKDGNSSLLDHKLGRAALSASSEEAISGPYIISPLLPEGAQQVITHYDDLAAAKLQTNLQAHWSATYHRLTPELKPLLQSRLDNYRLTASDLTSFIDVQYGGPLEFYNSRILSAPREPATPQIILGNLIHATFEKVTKEHITDEQALDYFQQELAHQPLDQQQQKDLLDKGSNSLQKSLQEFGSLLRSEHAHAEVSLSPEHPHLGDIPLTGKLDHIQIDDEHKTIEVYDFKTGGYHENAWNSHPTLYKYRLQLGFYKLLLNNSPTYRNYQVTRGHILFVTPKTHEDTVHDKIYEFNDTDEAELKSLLAAVYQQIKSLDFLNDPDLAIYPDKNATLKQLKEFTKLLIDRSRS